MSGPVVGEQVQSAIGTEGLTEYVCQFVREVNLDAIPSSTVAKSLCSILDGLGVALAGAVSAPGRLLHRYLQDLGVLGNEGATIIGSAQRAHPRFAALANGVSVHADDYDDTQLAVATDRVYGLLTHPTAPVLPAALASAERAGASGAEFLAAYNIGVEVESKIAEAINPRHYVDGFHSTGTCGTFGAAAAASKLMGLNTETMQRAMSIAASQAAGLRENFGTMTKPFHAGRACEGGMIATELARLGWTASPEILTAQRGFFRAAGGGYDESAIRSKLGNPWVFDSPGVSIKPHPSGSLTHPAMTELARLIAAHNIVASDVQEVSVGTNRNMPNALIYHQPQTELEAKFSMEFCIAILLIEGRAGLAEFTDETVHRADVQEMIKRVDFRIDAEAEAAGYDKMTSIISIRMHAGEIFNGRADFGKGSPANPMTFEEVGEKFLGCASFADWPSDKSERIIELVASLASLDDLEELTACLRP